jgi:hypothetical protein
MQIVLSDLHEIWYVIYATERHMLPCVLRLLALVVNNRALRKWYYLM